ARDRGDHRRLDDPEAGPAEDEGEAVSEALADEDVEAARARMRHGHLRECQGSAEGEDAPQDPREERPSRARQLLRDRMWRPEDAGSDDAAHRDRGRGVEPDLTLERRLAAR